MPDSDSARPLELLSSVFGFPDFRPGQQRAIDALLAGRSVLAIFPTGAGKSLCYQLPALLLDGITLVVSPLIALMKDQIDFLVGRGIPAARLDSSLTTDEYRSITSDLHAGNLRILYVAPERLANERFLETLRRMRIAMLAVDEAHCISEWGHNFRPDYMKLAGLAKDLNVGRVLALTATATPSVARDIAAAFDIAPDDVVQTGFYRPNLSMRVASVDAGARARLLTDRILQRQPRGPTIVYVTLQQTAEDVAALLNDQGIDAAAYHAGMDADVRHAVQDAFMASDGKVIVATIAFGMGIDKRNIRYVYHFNLPKSLENYAQETGRAGRDGEPSVCELLACADDAIVLENFTYGDTPTDESIGGLLDHILPRGEAAGSEFDVSTHDLSGEFDVRPLVVETLFTYLELDGVLQSTGPFYSEYKFQPTKSSAQILAKFDPQRQQFLKRVLSHARKGRTWYSINLDEVCADLEAPRQRVVAAMTYLEEQGDLTLQAAGARRGYRRLRDDVARDELTRSLIERFARREERDIARVRQVLDFVSHRGCYTLYLLNYFGETRDADCGHCGWCLGERADLRASSSSRPSIGARERELVAELQGERHAALRSPRQIARFLCGISSPAATRAKLNRDRRFGAMGGVPFADVLALAEGG